MDKLIYFSARTAAFYDRSLQDDSYEHQKWINLSQAELWPWHFNSRTGISDIPWPLAETVCPIPTIDHRVKENFNLVIESIAEEFVRLVEKSGRRPYICWSGGIDSTAILVSLLKVCSQDFLKDLTILFGKNIHQENGYFYHHFIKDHFNCQDIDGFKIDSSNYDKIIVVDGEAGNQIMGHAAAYKLLYFGSPDVLDQDWRKINNLTEIYTGSSDFHHQLIQESIPHAPVPITTVYDYFWWLGFNFKLDDVLIRKMLDYGKYLDPAQTEHFWKHGLYRFYSHDVMQQWSMITLDQRRNSCKKIPKYEQKKYIFDFDQNPFWFAHKQQERSTSDIFFRLRSMKSVFALDQKWKKYSFSSKADRQYLGHMLGKI